MEKASKSILSVAQCVAVRYRRNGLAMFLNKRAVLPHIRETAVFCNKLACPFLLLQCSVLIQPPVYEPLADLLDINVLTQYIYVHLFCSRSPPARWGI